MNMGGGGYEGHEVGAHYNTIESGPVTLTVIPHYCHRP